MTLPMEEPEDMVVVMEGDDVYKRPCDNQGATKEGGEGGTTMN